jgi:hypothetical protein
MIDLGLDMSRILPWFGQIQESPCVVVRCSDGDASAWARALGVPVRRCYLTDESLEHNAARTGRSKAQVVAARLPDRGSIRSGDFGEILTFLYQATCEHPAQVIGPKKWRLKEDRNHTAPHSDIIQFVVPRWPEASECDRVLCSEVKTKATAGPGSPVAKVIVDCEKPRTSRLTKTLLWLRDRAITEDLGSTTVGHLERFINATDHPPAQKLFRGVVVICTSLLEAELNHVPDEKSTDYTIVIIAIAQLQQLYEEVFEAAQAIVPCDGDGV